MRLPAQANCDRTFIQELLLNSDQRIDGRHTDQYRNVELTLGREYGSCMATLGHTKVFTHASCDLVIAKDNRPNEGMLFVNVELSPMANNQFEVGKLGEKGIELTRLLERIIKESNCVDTESLCIVAHERVWQIRVDVHILDDDGGLVDVASACAIAALAHLRIPDVTVTGQLVTVHDMDSKQPISLCVFHYPIAVTFGVTQKTLVADPSLKEIGVLEGAVVVAFNGRKELCVLHCSGGVAVDKSMVLKCCSRGLQRALEVIKQIKQLIIDDNKLRAKYQLPTGLSSLIGSAQLNANSSDWQPLDVTSKVEEVPVDPTFGERPASPCQNGAVVRSSAQAPQLMSERDVGPEIDLQLAEEIMTALPSKVDKPKKQRKKRRKGDMDDLLEEIQNDCDLLET